MYFISTMWLIKREGVKILAVEAPSDETRALDVMLKTGALDLFNRHTRRGLDWEISFTALMRTAHLHGIRVIPVDMPMKKRGNYRGSLAGIMRVAAKRDAYIYKQLMKLRGKGKVLFAGGSAHAGDETKGHPTARALLKKSGVRTGSIKVEDREAILLNRSEAAARAYAAFVGGRLLSNVIAVPTTVLGAMTFQDSGISLKSGRINMLQYRKVHDYVFFLPSNIRDYDKYFERAQKEERKVKKEAIKKNK